MTVFTHFENAWQEGAPLVQSAMAQSFMHGSTVFDGARAFSGCVPDLDRHFSRLINSAEVMGLKAPFGVQEITDLAIEGIKKFPANAELYIRPALFAEGGFLVPDAGDVRFVMTVFDVPMPEPSGFGACLSDFRRPNPDMAPTEAKAACLYPNSSLAIKEANRRGFENAVMRDGADNVVEFASSNLWFAKDGEVVTPSPNRTFLNGVTRQRVMSLLIENGLDVREREVKFEDVVGADEVFSTGNLGKVLPVTRVEEHHFPVGPICLKAREAYFSFAACNTI
jgi:branched-chain amino acid aminotransferase